MRAATRKQVLLFSKGWGGGLASSLHKPFEDFAGAPTPFRSPGNHGNEDQERTLSCWRPEPGFGGGNERRERRRRGCSKTHSLTLQDIRWEAKCTKGKKKNMQHRLRKVRLTQDNPLAASSSAKAQLTVLESNSCLFCAKTFSTPACSAYVTNPNPL